MSKRLIQMSENDAREMYYQINQYFLFLQSAENVDKCFFDKLKFWNPSMNNHLRKARESVNELLKGFNNHFKPLDSDLVKYEAPSELYRVMDFFSRLNLEVINEVMDDLERSKENYLNRELKEAI